MTMKSTAVNMPSTLLEAFVERARVSWRQVAVAVGLVLILFLVCTANPIQCQFLAGWLAVPRGSDSSRGGA
jgi:hypothetical protein